MNEQIDVVVVGAGQAGLALSHELTRQHRAHILLERAPRLADSWRNGRWDSFALVTPNWSLRLPGFPYHGDDPDGFLPRDAVVQHVEAYADSFGPPIRFGVNVAAVTRGIDGAEFSIATDTGELRTRNVVIATGLFQRAKLPSAAVSLPPHLVQLHSGQYRNPAALPPGAVLVVGTAQSGCQIADELYHSGRRVFLSVSSAGRLPRRYRGHDIFWWLEQMGFFATTFEAAPLPKSRYAGNPHLSGKDGGKTLNLHHFARDGVTLVGRVRGIENQRIHFAPDLHENLAKADKFAATTTQAIDSFIERSGTVAPPEAGEAAARHGFAVEMPSDLNLVREGITSVVWATGYAFDFSWIDFPVCDQDGYPIQERGVTAIPGLYFLGMHWLHTRQSGLFLGVGDDAVHLAAMLAERSPG